MTKEPLSISELAREADISTHTLRYYERIGLMPETERTVVGRHRRYSQRYVGWIRFLRRLRATGMPIRMVRQYVALIDRGEEESWDARRRILADHREDVARQIKELQSHLVSLDRKLDRGCSPNRETTWAQQDTPESGNIPQGE